MIGSSLDARRAGHIPKKIPTKAEKPNARATDSGATAVSHCASSRSAAAPPIPRARPSAPPESQSTSASIRN